LSFHLSFGSSIGLSIGLSLGSSVGLSTGPSVGCSTGLSPGFPSLFLLNVLENQGKPTTNHLAPPSIASVHGLPGITFEISKKAWLILEAAS
jgi:hypothetical protein